MATKKKPVQNKSAQANLSGGAGQGGRTSDLRGGGGPGAGTKVKNRPATKKK